MVGLRLMTHWATLSNAAIKDQTGETEPTTDLKYPDRKTVTHSQKESAQAT